MRSGKVNVRLVVGASALALGAGAAAAATNMQDEAPNQSAQRCTALRDDADKRTDQLKVHRAQIETLTGDVTVAASLTSRHKVADVFQLVGNHITELTAAFDGFVGVNTLYSVWDLPPGEEWTEALSAWRLSLLDDLESHRKGATASDLGSIDRTAVRIQAGEFPIVALRASVTAERALMLAQHEQVYDIAVGEGALLPLDSASAAAVDEACRV
ncbi:MAG TPA: hypothetical protein VM142_08765 [Acidimicrobiales bacterium]|nr:hypothetical protein [Acidimicrobiales bacterium]